MSEIDNATYSPEDNKIRLYSGRVSKELYDTFRESGFQRAYTQGCFFATWTPEREDIALQHCGSIEDEDTSLAERAAERNERAIQYSDNAKDRKTDAWARSRKATAGIPFGQPILVGHHSERRHRNAIEKSRRLSAKGMEELHKENYWTARAQASLDYAERKFKPRTVYNRIKKLEAEIRKQERYIDPNNERWHHDKEWMRSFHKYTEQEIDRRWESRCAHAERWIGHLQSQVAFWKTIYAASAQVPADREQFEISVGDWIRGRSGWGQVKRITRRDGEILSVSLDKKTLKESWWPHVVKYQEIAEHRTSAPNA